MSSRYDERRHERIARRLEELRAWRNAREHPIADWSFTAGGTSTSLTLGDFWPVVATPVQFAAGGDVPEAWAGEPVELELWLGGEGFLRLSTGFQAGLDPFHHSFPISEAARGGEQITIEAEVVPKGMFGSHVAEPRLERAHFVVPHHEVRALERDLTMIAQAAQELGEHEVVPHLLDIVEAAFAIYGPAWPSASDTARVAARARLRQPDRQRRQFDLSQLRGRGVRRPPLLDADLASAPASSPPGAVAGRGARRGANRPHRGRAAAGTAQAGLSPGRAAGAHRPCPHRPGLALAGGGDEAQGASHLRHRARPDGALPRFHLQPVIGAALRLDRGGRSRSLRAGQGARRRGPLGADRRLVGRARLPDHRRRVVSSASSSTGNAPSKPGSANARRSRGCRTSSGSRVGFPSSCAAPGSTASSPPSSTGTKRTSSPTTSSPGKGSTAAG